MCTIGTFNHVTDSLWRDQVDDGTPFTRKFLDIKLFLGDTNSIQKMSYEEDIAFTGVWNHYEDCISSEGAIQSELSSIGKALFEGCNSYADALKSISPEHYRRALKAMGTKEFLDAIRDVPNLGFLMDDVPKTSSHAVG